MSHPNLNPNERSRQRAILLVAPFLALGIGEIALLLTAGFNPLWAVVIVPPILFMTGLGWLSFTTGFDDQ